MSYPVSGEPDVKLSLQESVEYEATTESNTNDSNNQVDATTPKSRPTGGRIDCSDDKNINWDLIEPKLQAQTQALQNFFTEQMEKIVSDMNKNFEEKLSEIEIKFENLRIEMIEMAKIDETCKHTEKKGLRKRGSKLEVRKGDGKIVRIIGDNMNEPIRGVALKFESK